MTTYIEYDLGDGATILIEAPGGENGAVLRSALRPEEATQVKAKKSFADALMDVKCQAQLLLKEINELQVSEAEVKFGINTVGELGNLAIGKLGVGVNYEVTLKWSKPKPKT
jgi:hypothetical protein